MLNQVEYRFADEPTAYRFLNTVAHWDVPKLNVKFGHSSLSVRVTYEVQTDEFDATLSNLDDLAGTHGGEEVY